MGALGYDLSPVQDHNFVGVLDGADPLSDDEAGPTNTQALQGLLDAILRLDINAAGAVIQDEYPRVNQQSASNRDPLLLPPGEHDAAFTHGRIIAIWEAGDELVCLGRLRCGDDFVLSGVRAAVADVLPDRATEEDGLLKHNADLPAQRVEAHIAHIMAIQHHLSLTHVVEAGDQIDDGALARARRPEQRHGLPWLGDEADSLQHRLLVTKVAEGDVLERNPAPNRRQLLGSRLVLYFDRGVQDLKDTLGASSSLRHGHDDHTQHDHREHGHHQIALKGHEFADGQSTGDRLIATSPDHGQCAQVGQSEDQGHDEGEHPANAETGIPQLEVTIPKPLHLPRLPGKGLHDPHSGQALL